MAAAGERINRAELARPRIRSGRGLWGLDRGMGFDRHGGLIAARGESGGECESEREDEVGAESSWGEGTDHGRVGGARVRRRAGARTKGGTAPSESTVAGRASWGDAAQRCAPSSSGAGAGGGGLSVPREASDSGAKRAKESQRQGSHKEQDQHRGNRGNRPARRRQPGKQRGSSHEAPGARANPTSHGFAIRTDRGLRIGRAGKKQGQYDGPSRRDLSNAHRPVSFPAISCPQKHAPVKAGAGPALPGIAPRPFRPNVPIPGGPLSGGGRGPGGARTPSRS